MKKLLDRNSTPFGVLLTLGSEVVTASILWLVLLLVGSPIVEQLRWFVIAYVPAILLLRYFAKDKNCPDTLKSMIVTLFVTFVAFMWFLLKYKYITF